MSISALRHGLDLDVATERVTALLASLREREAKLAKAKRPEDRLALRALPVDLAERTRSALL